MASKGSFTIVNIYVFSTDSKGEGLIFSPNVFLSVVYYSENVDNCE